MEEGELKTARKDGKDTSEAHAVSPEQGVAGPMGRKLRTPRR